MSEIVAPALPEGLTQRQRLVLSRMLNRLRSAGSSTRFVVWDECRAATAALVDLNVFYVVMIDPVRRTRTIDYIKHRSKLPEIGMVGDPYGPVGLCPRLVENDKPYFLSEDDGAIFRSGYAFMDEFDAKDAVAVHIHRPDGSLYGALVASSLSANQFNDDVVRIMRWLGEVGYLFRYRPLDAVNDGVWYPELGQMDLPNWTQAVLQATREAVDNSRDALAARELDSCDATLEHLSWQLFQAQSRLVTAHHEDAELLNELSPRELDIMRELARDGNVTNPMIAERLGTSVANVKKHLSTALRKTGATNREDLRRLAVRWRL